MTQFVDRLTIDRAHRTRDGFLKVTAKGARSGIQQYLGREVDPEGKTFKADQLVKVYRPPEEVFDQKVLASFVGRPITDEHPSVSVTAKNWRDYSRGVVGGAVKDGEWIRFDMALMDAALIEKVDGGKRELSCGYSCSLSIEDGTAPDGTAYQAVQRGIVGNHLAVVDQARAGPDARIADRIADGGNELFAACDTAAIILSALDAHEELKNMPHTLIIDGLQVTEVSDQAKAAIEKLQGQFAAADKARTDAETQVATLATEKATLDAKVTTLEKQVADSKLTPALLRDAAKAYAAVVDKAKALGVTVTDEMDELAIQKAVVTARLGDDAKDWTDVQIAASFATLTKDVKGPTSTSNVFPIIPTGQVDTASIRDAARAARR